MRVFPVPQAMIALHLSSSANADSIPSIASRWCGRGS